MASSVEQGKENVDVQPSLVDLSDDAIQILDEWLPVFELIKMESLHSRIKANVGSVLKHRASVTAQDLPSHAMESAKFSLAAMIDRLVRISSAV